MDKKSIITIKKNDLIQKVTVIGVDGKNSWHNVDWSIVTSVDDMTIYATVIAYHCKDTPEDFKGKKHHYHDDLVSAGYTIIYDIPKKVQVKAGDYVLKEYIEHSKSGKEKNKKDYYFILDVDSDGIDLMAMSGKPFKTETVWNYDDFNDCTINGYETNEVTIVDVIEKVCTFGQYSVINDEKVVGYRYIYGDKAVLHRKRVDNRRNSKHGLPQNLTQHN